MHYREPVPLIRSKAFDKSTATAMADSLLTRLLLQSLVIFRIAVQHEWFFRNPERFRDLVEIFAAVITGRPRRDFGRRDFGTSARSRPDFGRDKGVWARSCLGPKIPAVKILPRIPSWFRGVCYFLRWPRGKNISQSFPVIVSNLTWSDGIKMKPETKQHQMH